MVISLTTPQLEKLGRKFERLPKLAHKLVLRGIQAELKDRKQEIDRLSGRRDEDRQSGAAPLDGHASESLTVEEIIDQIVGQ